MRGVVRQAATFFFWVLSHFARPFLSGPQVIILCYHSVEDSGWKYGVSPKQFRRQMEFLKSRRRPVSLADAVRFVKGEIALPDGSVAITFDDGYFSAAENAFPVLRELGIPAAFFVVTEAPDRSELGNDFALAGWDKIREMKMSGLVEIGSHSATHSRMDKLTPDEVKRELRLSSEAIKKETGSAPRFFSYPKGRFSESLIEEVKNAGYEAAVSVKQGMVRRGDNLYCLKRVEIRGEMPMWEFKARTTIASDWLAGISKRFGHA